jgi:deazaflavin-dependent oxidoreductase (nitroreductase family)
MPAFIESSQRLVRLGPDGGFPPGHGEEATNMTERDAAADKKPTMPPGWIIRIIWAMHRAAYRWTGGRRGLWRSKAGKWGTFRLHTVGRTSGKERIAILGYQEDGPNIVTVAMNGWMEGDPAWWINLQANPDARIELKGRTLNVHARAAAGDERERLWHLFPNNKRFVDHRATHTAVVVLEPSGANSA